MKKQLKVSKLYFSLLVILFYFASTPQCFSNNLQSIVKNENAPQKQIELLHNLYNNAIEHNIDSAIIYADYAMQISQENNLRTSEALSYKLIGNAYLYKAYYNLALDNYYKSLSIYEIQFNKTGLAHVNNNIAIIYKRIGKYDLALEYFEKTLVLQKSLKNAEGITWVYGNIGTTYTAMEEYSKAIDYLTIAINGHMLQTVENKIPLSKFCNNLGFAYYKIGEIDQANKYYTEAIKLATEIGNWRTLSLIYNNYGYLYFSKKDYNTAVDYFNKSLDISKEYEIIEYIRDNYYALYEANTELGKYKNANTYITEYTKLNDSINSLDNETLIEELRLSYDIADKEKMIAILQKDKQIESIKKYILISGIVLLIVIGLLFFSKLRSQKRLIKIELDTRKLKSKLLHEELNHKNKQLTDFALYIIQRNELIIDIKKHIKDIKKTKSLETLGEKLKNLDRQISSSSSLSKDIKIFNTQVEAVNQSFFQTLATKFPNLTQNEKNISALLRLNLSSKAIAALLDISSKSVDTYRYNIRKKMDLLPTDNINVFLNSI